MFLGYTMKKYLLLGHISLFLLMFLAVVYADVRVLFTDAAYQVFYDINHPGVLINDSRYSMFLTQILPWLAVHLHLPLKTIIVVYSLSFILVGYACFFITAYTMRQPKAAVAMLFVFFAIGGTFFHCISESFQLMFYAPMLFAWMCVDAPHAGARRFAYYLILALLVALNFFIYPMSTFYVLFAVGFRLLKEGRPKVDVSALVTAAILLLYIVLYWIIGPSGHDSQFVPSYDVITYSIGHFFSLGSFQTFLVLFPRLYFVPTLLLVVLAIFYIRRHQWWKLAFVVAYCVLFVIAASIIYQTGDSRIARERYFMPLFFFVAIPFLVDLFPCLSRMQERITFIIFMLLLAYSFGRILHYAHRFQPRLQAIEQVSFMARQQGQHKILVIRSLAEDVFPDDAWDLSLSSMLLTAQQGPENTVTIYKEEDGFNPADTALYHNPDVYLAVPWWKQWNVADLNPRYFALPRQGYKQLVRADDSLALSYL